MRAVAWLSAALRSPYVVRLGLVALAMCLVPCWARSAAAQIIMPQVSQQAPITILAPSAFRWQQGNSEVWHLRGGCRIEQGTKNASASEALVWIDRHTSGPTGAATVTAYLEGQVFVNQARSGAAHARVRAATDRVQAKTFLVDFQASAPPQMKIGRVEAAPSVPPCDLSACSAQTKRRRPRRGSPHSVCARHAAADQFSGGRQTPLSCVPPQFYAVEYLG